MKQLRFAALLVLLLGMSQLRAQMSGTTYFIQNNQNCDITVHYEVTNCSGIVCNNPALVIGPGGIYWLPAGCANAGWDIFVWLKEMDYVDVTNSSTASAVTIPGGCFGGNPSSSTPLTPAQTAAFSTGCASTSGNYVLNCTPGGTTIGY